MPHSEIADTMTGMSATFPLARWARLRRSRLSRRALLQASVRAGVGAAGLVLVGCSDDEPQPQESQPQQQSAQADAAAQQAEQAEQSAQQPPAQQAAQQAEQADASADAQAAPPAGPVRGGILRMWLPVERHDRWDPHLSRYRYTQAAHSLMYNRLIQPSSVASGALEADLCALPETPDETTYIFTLTPGAVFWNQEPTNGRAVTAQDLSWNITRQQEALDAAGLPDPHFFRRAAYQRTASVEAASDDALTLTTTAPDAAYLASVHASPFAWITSPEAAELYADDWRDDPFDVMRNSGSGPYTPRAYNGFELALARSDNWWRADSAWADGIILASGDPNSIPSLYSAAAIDRADFPLTNEAVEVLREQYPEHEEFELPLGASVELLAPLASDPGSPLADARVIRAIELAIDRPALIERFYGGHGRASGPLPWYLDGWSLSESLLATHPGYRDDRDADLSEIAALISAAGADGLAPVPLVVADLFEGFFAGSGEAVRSMIADATGLDVELENRPFAEAIDQLRGGERFCCLGWSAVPQQADPTDEWRRTLHSAGEQNWSASGNAELDALIDRMGATFDRGARQDIAHLVQEMLLNGGAPQWQLKLVSGVQLGLRQPWFHPDPRLFEYAWSTGRLSGSWLDQTAEGYPVERELPPLPEEEPADGG